MGKKNVMHDDAGKKIGCQVGAMNRKAKKKKLNRNKEARHKHFEEKMLQRSPEDIMLEIRQLKADHERKTKCRIDITKWSIDRLTQLEVGYERMKEEVQEEHKKRMGEQKSSMYIDFEELKVHRKASIYYHPVKNPYGAPPSGQTLMYRHPDGSVQREPPPVGAKVGGGDAEMPPDGSSDESGSSGSEEGSEDDDADPLLPDSLPGMPSAPSGSIGPGLPPLPPGAPPLPPGQPPLPGQPFPPLGQPPLPLGQPPLPFGAPPLPFGQPPLPMGQPPLPLGQPLLPLGGMSADMSMAAFMGDLSKAGFQLPGLPPGPPPKPKPAGHGIPPGPPPKKAQPPPKAKSPPQQSAPETPAKAKTVSGEMPAGAKPPPPPPKKAAEKPKPALPSMRAATTFMPTTLRTKKPSQVAGGVLQATSSSLAMVNRKNLIATEVPRVSEKMDVDDAMEDFLQELDM